MVFTGYFHNIKRQRSHSPQTVGPHGCLGKLDELAGYSQGRSKDSVIVNGVIIQP